MSSCRATNAKPRQAASQSYAARAARGRPLVSLSLSTADLDELDRAVETGRAASRSDAVRRALAAWSAPAPREAHVWITLVYEGGSSASSLRIEPATCWSDARAIWEALRPGVVLRLHVYDAHRGTQIDGPALQKERAARK